MRITYSNDIEPEDVLNKAISKIKDREASKGLRDPYLNSIHREMKFIGYKIMESMLNEITDVLIGE